MKFQGKYTEEIKNLLIASAVSGQNAVLVGPPGWGKTHMALTAAHAVADKGGTIFLEFDPSTPPEVVKGAYNPAALLDGKLERVFDDTPYDKRAKVVICDELFRTSDIVFDAFIHVTENKTRLPSQMPVFWATANHVADYNRVEALRDRFALWMYLDVGKPDVKNIVKSHLSNGIHVEDPTWKSSFPSWKECMEIRRSHPGKVQIAMVSEFISALSKESHNCGFEINPRRIVQWSAILYCYSSLLSGTTAFQLIPKDVMRMLSYAYPNVNAEDAEKWRTAVLTMVDKEGAALIEIVENIKTMLNGIVTSKDAFNDEDFKQLIISKTETALSNLEPFVGDARTEQFINGLKNWSAQAVSGTIASLEFLGVVL